MNDLLRERSVAEISTRGRTAIDAETVATAAGIVGDVLRDGEPAVRRWAEQLGDLEPGAPLVIGVDDCRRALASLGAEDRSTLERVHERILAFKSRVKPAS